MIIDLYTFKPLPIEMRTEFELRAWPYGEYRHVFEEQMKELHAFRYEDTEMTDGDRNINYALNFEISNKLIYPFLGFHSKFAVSNAELKIIPWPADKQESFNLLKRLDEDDVAKDRMAWLKWNVPGDVEIWDLEKIKFTPKYEFMKDNLTKKGKCYEADLQMQNRNKAARKNK